MDRPKIKLVGEDGNAFSILGRCQKAAQQAGWSKEELDRFMAAATSGGYDHLLCTVTDYFDCDCDNNDY